MRIHKKPKRSSLRQRLRPDQDESRRSVSQTFSYHTQRSEQLANTGRADKAFRQQILNPVVKTVGSFWLEKFGLGILLIVGGICLVSALTVSPRAKLQQLGSVNQSSLFHHQAAYQATADDLLSSSLFNRNKITINTAKLSQQLLSKYPELSNASVALPLLSHRPIIYLSYTQPAIIMHNQTGSYVLDTAGKVLTPTSPEAIVLGLPSVTDESGFKLALNNQVLTSTDVSFIQTVIIGLKAKNIAVGSMTLPAAANELDVAIAGKPYFVKFNLHADATNSAKLQIGSFLAVQQRLAGQSVTPSKYIDVRVSGRAYYQ